jgi:hypothetical protein
MQVCRSGFTMKLMKLKLQGPSLVCASSKALGGALINVHLVPNFVFFFHKEGPKIV